MLRSGGTCRTMVYVAIWWDLQDDDVCCDLVDLQDDDVCCDVGGHLMSTQGSMLLRHQTGQHQRKYVAPRRRRRGACRMGDIM